MRKRGILVLLLAISFLIAAFLRSDDLRLGLFWAAPNDDAPRFTHLYFGLCYLASSAGISWLKP
jgi:hypothetical protein